MTVCFTTGAGRYMLLVLLSIALSGCSSSIKKLHKIVRDDFGHSAIHPPHKLFKVGTVIRVRKQKPVIATIVCYQEEALKKDFKVVTSPSITAEFVRKTSGQWNLGAEYVDKVNATFKQKFVKNIKFTLKNAKVFGVADTQFKLSKECRKRVAHRLKLGQKVTTVMSVIQADVDFLFEFSTNADAKVKAQIITSVSAEFSLQVSGEIKDKIQGKGLYWGLIDDATVLHSGNGKIEKSKGFVRRRLVPKTQQLMLLKVAK